MKYFSTFIIMIFLLSGCSQNKSNKIKLAAGNAPEGTNQNTTSSVIQIDEDAQHSIAVLHFVNRTGIADNNWLARGLADMLVAELSQSPYFAVIGVNKLYEVAYEMGQNDGDMEDLLTAAMVAKNAQADILLKGAFEEKNNRFEITVEILDVVTSQVISKEMISGKGPGDLLVMVDELSTQVANNIHGKLDENLDGTIQLSQMTNSVEAFRCYSEALSYYEKFLPDAAKKCLMDAVKLDSTFAIAYLKLAQHYFIYGKKDASILAYNRTKKYSGKLAEPDKIEMQILEKHIAGKYEAVVPILKNAVLRFPNNVDLRLRLARHYRSRRNLEKALEHFEIALEKAPASKLIYNDLGYLFAERGDFSTAIKYFIKYQRLAPNEPNPYDSHGEILLYAGKFEEAIQKFETALEKWPTFYNSARQLCEIYTELGEYEKAMKYLARTKNSLSSGKMPHYGDYLKFKLYWRFGKNIKADILLQTLLKSKDGYARFTNYALEFYRTTGTPDKAQEVFKTALQYFENNILSGKYDEKMVYAYIGLILRENIVPDQVLPILNIIDGEKFSYEIKSVYYFAKGLFNLRAKNFEAAQDIFASGRSGMFSLLVDNLNIGRGRAWKYVYESLENYAPQDKPDFSALNGFLERAKKSEIEYIKSMAILGQARNFKKAELNESALEIYRDLGIPQESQWRIMGPFKAEKKSAFTAVFPPEKFRKTTVKSVQNNSDTEFDGYVDLNEIVGKSTWSAAYAELEFYSPVMQKVQIRLGTDETCKLWLNEEQIWQHYIKRDAVLDRDILSVRLKQGKNKILLKVTNTDFDWGFYFRITDKSGQGIEGLEFGTQPGGGLAAG